MLLSAYALVALLSTVLATPTPTRDFKQASRAEVVRRVKRGVRPRAPVPSGAGGAPTSVTPNPNQGKFIFNYNLFYTGSGRILSANAFPLETTFPNTESTANAAQRCVDFAFSQGDPGDEYYGAVLYYDESDDLWHCQANYDSIDNNDLNAEKASAKPVYGYSR